MSVSSRAGGRSVFYKLLLFYTKCMLCIQGTSERIMFLIALVCLSVCLFVCLFVCRQHYSKLYERNGMKFYGKVLGSTMKSALNFGGDLGILRYFKMSI